MPEQSSLNQITQDCLSVNSCSSGCESFFKKVINRLIDISSPPSDAKKRCFCKLVTGDDGADAIIVSAHENGTSVEDTKI